MDPDQLAALVVAAGSVLAAFGLRRRKGAIDNGRGTTLGLALGRAGSGAARLAGNVTGTTGRAAADTAAAGIRIVGATVAHSAGLVVDGASGLSTGAARTGWSLIRRPVRTRPPEPARNDNANANPATTPAPATTPPPARAAVAASRPTRSSSSRPAKATASKATKATAKKAAKRPTKAAKRTTAAGRRRS